MNASARDFAQSLDLERPVVEYGPTFKYSKVYYANFNGEYITVEEFIEGTFAKYINNTGDICNPITFLVLSFLSPQPLSPPLLRLSSQST